MRSSFREQAQCGVARVLARLPDRVKVALSGEPPVVVDGLQLDPQLQLLRSIRLRRGARGLLAPSIPAGRERYRRETRIFRGPMTQVAAVKEFEISGSAFAQALRRGNPAPLRVRHYAPHVRNGASTKAHDATAARPLLVYLHGGGFVIGDLDTHDEPCRILCRHAGVHVLSVAYRLAPEHPFPAAVDDAQTAFAWARANAASLGADPRHVAIGGDSAGANLAAVVSLTGADASRPDGQLLIYPATDLETARPSQQLFADGFILTMRDREAFYRHYVNGNETGRNDPRLSPMCAQNLASAPRALVVVAGFDPLRDEGDAYASALQDAGGVARVLRFPTMEHGFIHLTGVCPAARRAMLAIANAWRELLDQTNPPHATHPTEIEGALR
jgi:acetyl esterase